MEPVEACTPACMPTCSSGEAAVLGKSLIGSFLLTLLFVCQSALAASPAVDPFTANGGPLAPLGPQDTVTIHIDEDPTQGPPVPIAVSEDGTVRFPYIRPL